MTPAPPAPPATLGVDALYRSLRQRFRSIPDARTGSVAIPLHNALMAGFALFALKDPSWLVFDQRRGDPTLNLQAVFGLQQIPSDTQLRALLDPVDPDALRPAFTDVFRELQRSKVLADYVFYEGCYLISLDGVEHFCSAKVSCASCLTRTHKNGTVSYYHQMLGACLVHPDHADVFPLMPEPIIKPDGATKNDCERNAAKRWLQRFRAEHYHLPVIIIEDALSANAPHIRELRAQRCHFILGVKPGDHGPLFAAVAEADDGGRTQQITWIDAQGALHHFRWLNEVALNDSNPDVLVNFLEYWEITATGEVRHDFSWVTDFIITEANVWLFMRGGRARWKIENNTFNTLKNQGYQFEHNYGHGVQNLSVVLALLMWLAFLVDQVQQRCNQVFGAAWEKAGSKQQLWERVRSLFRHHLVESMQEMYAAIAHGIVLQRLQVCAADSS